MSVNDVTPPNDKNNTTPLLEVRINQIDYVLSQSGQLDNSSLPNVPVLRIFGTSSTGQTACVHVHQVYPYFYVEYPGKLGPRQVHKYISKLSRSLNHAISVSLKKDPLSAKSRYVRAVVLVKGVHFYGFHCAYSPFLKIYAANPSYVTRMVSILQSGSVMGCHFRVFESHLSYILQFLCDFDLYGCGIISIENALERCPEYEDSTSTPFASKESIKFEPSPYFRESKLPLEIDIIPFHILNRHRLQARNLHHRLNTSISYSPASEPLILSVRELWDDERKQRQALGLPPTPEMPVDPTESTRDTSSEWISETRWWEEIRERVERESNAIVAPKPDEPEREWERYVMTTFESVEAIWEKEYRSWKPETARKEHITPDNELNENPPTPEYIWDVQSHLNSEETEEYGQVDVDVSMFSDTEMERLDQEEADRMNGVPRRQEDREENVDEADDDEEDIHEEDIPESPVVMPEDGIPDDLDPFAIDPESAPIAPEDYQLKEPLSPSAYRLGQLEKTTTQKESTSQFDTELDLTPKQDTGVLLSHSNENCSQLQDLNPAPTSAGRPEETGGGLDVPPPGTAVLATPATSPAKRFSVITARAVKLSAVFDHFKATNSNQYAYALQPPSTSTLLAELKNLGLPSKIYRSPYYSRDEDIPEQSKEYAGLMYRLKGGKGIATLEEWHTADNGLQLLPHHPTLHPQLDPSGVGGWEYANHPPSAKEVRRSLHLLQDASVGLKALPTFKSQIEGPTQSILSGFKATSIADKKLPARQTASMSILSVEVFAPTQGDKVPDPELNGVAAVFCAFNISGSDDISTSVLVLADTHLDFKRMRYPNMTVHSSEEELLTKLVDLVLELDPDILTGWEVQNGSWGYLQARVSFQDMSLSESISRAVEPFSSQSNDEWAVRKASTLKIVGRHVLNLWRIMRSERTLTTYTFENVVYDVLQRRVPKYSYRTLTDWYYSDVPAHTSYLFDHMSMHTIVNLQVLEATEVVGKTAEFARVFGVDFFSVLTRGSQFKVESFMFRLAKPESFVLISPSRSDVGQQNAAECMPLIMEPQSAFYSSPVVVLDFQSLYPSLMIAYNYCYSTCLGRVSEFQGRNQLGVTDDLKLPPNLLAKLQNHITVAPNGMIYVKPNIRKGLLGRMLTELLETRVMVKQAMKRPGTSKARKRILDARQLSLKYIANVTYGYTSASFSGRMPAVEIADSIVQSGRETLEKAIDIIDSTAKWGAKVVYGDTDSVFVYLPGKTKEEAFSIGYEMSDTITAMNPAPIKLKFEKVYLPCVLMAKKRYVGFKYESINDTEPVFDAKGIETVRRDGVLAQRKMVETCLKILFRSQDLSEVKDYCCRSWTKMLENRAPVQDFIFAKEVKMGTYRGKGPPPPGVVIAARRMVNDPNDEPKYGDRIPYVIVRSATGARLVDRAMDPLDFMENSELRLDAAYYITHVLIPPLERIFNLVGADVQQWFSDMPRTIVPEFVSPRKPSRVPMSSNQNELEDANINALNGHFSSMQCLSCGEHGTDYLCEDCCRASFETFATLNYRIRTREERLKSTHEVCVSCTHTAASDPIECESLDCQWFYARRKAQAGMELVPLLQDASKELAHALHQIENASDDDDEAMDYANSDIDYALYGTESDAEMEE